MLNKRAISPVVATALLLVVGVTAVIGFQNFFGSFSSGLFSDVETENSVDKSLRIEGIFTNTLYLKSGEDTNLSLLKIVDSSGNLMCSFSGSGEVNSSELIGWWKLNDENSTIVDLSGNGNNGKLYGNTRLLLDFDSQTATDRTSYNNTGTLMNGVECTVTGVNGKGCTFDGVNDYINFSTSSNLNFSTGFSLSVWINTNNQTFSYPAIMEKGSGDWTNCPGAHNGFWLGRLNTNAYYFRMSDNSNTCFDTVAIANLNFSRWYNLIITVDSGTSSSPKIKAYLDGNLVSSSNRTYLGSFLNQSSALNIGAWVFANDYFNGSIDEVAIYSKALSQEEITDLYNSQKAKFVEFKTSKLDKSVEFDGVDDYIIINVTGSEFQNIDFPTHNITIFAKAISEGVTLPYTTDGPIFSSYRYDLWSDKGFFAGMNGGSYWTGRSAGNASLVFSKYSNVLTYTKNNLTSSIYSNGVLKNSVVSPANYGGYSILNILLGSTYHGGRAYTRGSIDEVRVYNRTLSDDEIKTLYWYSLKPIEAGINEIDVTLCNLATGEYYDVVAFSDKNRVEMKVIAK